MLYFNNHTITFVETTCGGWVSFFREHWSNDDVTRGGFNNGVTPAFPSKVESILYAMKEINQWIEDEYSTHKNYFSFFKNGTH